ncbi:putative ATP-dependent RNA helicase TDRD12 [Cylas formicarius]|uniref:putative ATP-dependent RNA helicase TDRD12 n=1 Tax=Cylas formicarius TaxID=197179 RepID=UPI002958373A|nr:putative ATP-dependent RNA helicase TDRD12 [Cylas formicarius]
MNLLTNTMDVNITTFINPHLFWVTENSLDRLNILNNISSLLQKVNLNSNGIFETDEIVGITLDKKLVRASIEKVFCSANSDGHRYFCWLIDYGKLIEVDIVYKLPRDLQDISPQSKQICLQGICYLKDVLKLGVTGSIKNVATAIPSQASYDYSMELFRDYTKFTFEMIGEQNGVLFGDLLIYKDYQVLSLSEELCNKKLMIKDDKVFEEIKKDIHLYKKTYLSTIHQICRRQNTISNKTTSKIKCSEDLKYEDMDFNVGKPLLNGRRRNINLDSSNSSNASSNETMSENEQANSSFSSSENIIASLLQKRKDVFKERKLGVEEKNHSNLPPEERFSNMSQVRKILESLRKMKSNGSDSENSSFAPSTFSRKGPPKTVETLRKLAELRKNKSKEGATWKQVDSPVVCIEKTAGKRKLPPNINLMPAGSERNLKTKKKVSKVIRTPTISSTNSVAENQSISTNTETDTAKSEDPPADRPPLHFANFATSCNCKDCNIRYEDDDWDSSITFSDSKCKKQLSELVPIIKPPLLLKPADKELVEESGILSVEFSKMSQMQRHASRKKLVHGESIPSPAERISQIFLHNKIYATLSNLGYRATKGIQMHACPAITRNQHVFLIGDRKSGKTMAYLPVMCSFVLERDRYSQLDQMGGGPIVLILCNESKKCEEVHDLAKVLLKGTKHKLSLITYPGHANLSNIDMLVTMPSVLNNLLTSRAINFKRLCHLVFDDAGVLLKNHELLVNGFLSLCDKMLTHRSCPKSVQLVVCSEHWTVPIEKLLKRLNIPPLVCITNYMEAALYGKMVYTIKFLNSACKEQELKQLLKNDHKIVRSLVVCQPEEVEEVYNVLMLKGIDATPIKDDVKREDAMYLEEVWNNARPGSYHVLICSDYTFNTMFAITNVALLIHYSLPQTWSQYVRRFSCLLDNCASPLKMKSNNISIRSVVLIDEQCESRMSKFGAFMRSSLLWDQLGSNLRSYLDAVKLAEERSKQAELCAQIKIFGTCANFRCKYRHLADKTVDVDDHLPQNGSIKFTIADVWDVTTCAIKILESFDTNGNSVGKMRDREQEILNQLAACPRDRCVKTPITGQMYMYADEDVSGRCRLLNVEADSANVVLVDKGTKIKVDVAKLFQLSAELMNIPSQIHEVYLGNFVPPHHDSGFSSKAFTTLKHMMDEHRCCDMVFRADIQLQLGHNLWLEDVVEERELFDKSLPTMGFQLSRELLRGGLVRRDDQVLRRLYELCKQADISLPDYEIKRRKVVRKVAEQPTPRWAFLDTQRVNEVTFSSAISPDEFYVKLKKFHKSLSQLEKDIQQEIRKPFYPVPEKIEVGKCYLAKDDHSGNYSRAIVRNIDGDHALCFFGDYGDETVTELSELKHLSDVLLERLPFQTIQCKMFGVRPVDEKWDNAATDLLYELGFEPGTDVFRTLYVKTVSESDNGDLAGQKCYSVILKDGFNKRHLLNNLLVDCGYGVPINGAIEDFAVSEPSSGNESDHDSDDWIEDGRENEETLENFNLGDDLEVFIIDFGQFCTDNDFLTSERNEAGPKKVEDGARQLPVIKAAPEVDYLTPDCLWSQTDSFVRLTIQIPDVSDYTVSVSQGRVFNFCTYKAGKKYLLNLILFDRVKKTFQHSALGAVVKVTLAKHKDDATWPRLLYSKNRFRNIHFDIDTLNVDDEKKRRFLELPISDDDKDEDDNDLVYYCSDRGSEYDEDIAELD